MRNLVYLSFCMLVLISCADKQNNSQETPVEININTNKLSNLCFNDLYEIKKVITLETIQESILSEIKKISFINDNIYVVTGEHLMECNDYVVFNKDGKFIYKQNKTGRGPGEYLKITSLHTNGDSIIVQNGKKLIYYNTKGEFLYESSNFPFSVYVDMCYVGNGNTLMNFAYPKIHDNQYFSLQLFSGKGEYIKGFLPIKEECMKMRFFAGTPIFTKYNNSIYFAPMTRNSIYEYLPEKEELKERYIISVDNHPVFDLNNIEYNDRWYFDNYHLWLENINNENIMLLIKQVTDKKSYYASINRKTNAVELFPRDGLIDKKNSLPVHLVSSETDYLLSIISSEDFKSLTISDTNSLGYKLKQSLNENSNPVIILYEQKNN